MSNKSLADARNELAEDALHRLDDQLAILSQIRDILCPDPEEPDIAVIAGNPRHDISETCRRPPTSHRPRPDARRRTLR